MRKSPVLCVRVSAAVKQYFDKTYYQTRNRSDECVYRVTSPVIIRPILLRGARSSLPSINLGRIIRKVRGSTDYLQAVRRAPRNCINFSNKTESYKSAAAGNTVRPVKVRGRRRGAARASGLLTLGHTRNYQGAHRRSRYRRAAAPTRGRLNRARSARRARYNFVFAPVPLAD